MLAVQEDRLLRLARARGKEMSRTRAGAHFGATQQEIGYGAFWKLGARPDMNLVLNERIKLTATWINTLAAATVATGVIAPIAAVAFGLPTTGTVSVLSFVLATLLWLLLGIARHLWARRILRSLTE